MMSRAWCATIGLAVLACVASDAPVRGQTAALTADRQFGAAVQLQKMESYDLAVDAWQGFLKDYPKDTRADKAFYNLGICAYQRQDLKTAAAAFQQVVSQYPQFELGDAAYLYLGMTQYALGRAGDKQKYIDAGRTFRDMATKHPKSEYLDQARYYFAESGYMAGNKEWAVEQYKTWLKDFPKSPLRSEALYALGVAQEETNDAAGAGATYETFLRENPNHELVGEVGLRRAETLFLAGDYKTAVTGFEAASNDAKNPLADYATLRKAESLARMKQYKPAADAFASIPTRFADSTYADQAKLSAGKCYYLSNDFPSARKWLTAAYQSNAQTKNESLHLIAQCLLKEGKPEEAAEFAVRMLPTVSNDPEKAAQLLLDQADAYYQLPNQRDEAEQLYATIAERFGNHELAPQALYMAAFSALERGDVDAASKHADAFLAKFQKSELLGDVLHVAAECAMQKNDPAKAEAYYAKALQTQPDSKNASLWKVRRATALHLQDKWDDVIRTLTDVVGQLNDKKLAAQAQFLMGDSHLRLKRYSEAAKWLELSIQSDGQWPRADETRFALAETYLARNEQEKVQAALNDLIRNHPQSRYLDRAYYRLAESHHAAGDLKSAASYYHTVASKYPKSPSAPDALYELACIQMTQNDAKSAEATLTSFLSSYPDHVLGARAQYVRGRARHQMKDFDGALEDLDASIEHLGGTQELADALYVLGLCQLGLERYEEAAASLSRLLKDSPSYPGADDARYQLAWAYKLAGKNNEALREFEALAQSHAESPLAVEGQYHVGEAAYKRKDYAKAADAFAKAATSADKTIARNATHKLAWARYQRDDIDGAIEAFEAQLASHPGGGAIEADARFMLAECLFQKEQFADALDSYKKLKPDDLSSDAYKSLALLHAGQAAAQGEDWDEAVRRLDALLNTHPDAKEVPLAMYELGWAQQNLGRAEEAVRTYRQVLEKTDAEPAARAQFMIGEIQFEKKQHSEAIKSYFNVLYGFSYPEWQAQAAFEAARCFEVLKKPTQAAKLYTELVEKFPESDQAPLAKQRLAELQQ